MLRDPRVLPASGGRWTSSSNRWLLSRASRPTVLCNQRLQEGVMEYGSIEREIYIEAAPEIVFDVVSSPHHLEQ